MLLHNDKELFKEVIISTADELGLVVPIVEKDYYVTMILKKLSIQCPKCVFKGGTSLSKCFHIIDRFSEDIDITFSDNLTQSMRKKLKNETIADISKELAMPILDWKDTHSRRDYNCYTFSYEPIEGFVTQGSLIPGVKMEVSLSTISIPKILNEIIDKEVYKDDYIEITTYFQNAPLEYEKAIEALKEIAGNGMFEE